MIMRKTFYRTIITKKYIFIFFPLLFIKIDFAVFVILIKNIK